jgi:hypothetical protein
VFVLLHQLHIFSLGRALPDQPPTCLPSDIPENSRARTAGLDASGPKLGAELRLGQFSIWYLIWLIDDDNNNDDNDSGWYITMMKIPVHYLP